jgi:hypothetical protein
MVNNDKEAYEYNIERINGKSEEQIRFAESFKQQENE